MSVLKRLSTSSLLALWLGVAAAMPPHDPSGWPTLNVAAHTFPPYQYKQDGKMVGPMVTIMELVCERARVKCEVTMDAFQVQYPKAIAGEYDVIYTFLLDADALREEQFALSPPIISTLYSFFTASTSTWTYTGKPGDLEGRTVGVYGPSGTQIIAERTVRQNHTATLVVERSNLVAFQQLVLGKYGTKAAIVVNREVGLALMKQNNITGPRIAGDLYPPVTFGFGVSRKADKAHLAPRMFAAVNDLKKEGVIQAILKKANLEPAP